LNRGRAPEDSQRYETFVIRLWVDGEAGFEHGEVQHVASGADFRFRDLKRAMKFIEDTAERKRERAPRASL
jgi:hypothetical protein